MRYFLVAITSKPLILTYSYEEKIDIGALVEVEIKSKIYKGYVLEEVEKPEFECKRVEKTTEFYLPRNYLEIAKFISTYYFCSIGEALGLFVPFMKEEGRRLKVEETKSEMFNSSSITLSPKQTEALNFIKSHRISLLFGDTGSGKTEIYMKYFEDLLKENKRAIFLMPEISLTPQMEERLKRFFGDSVAVWHSRLTKKRKNEILDGIYCGKTKIVAGPRSALFLPITDLGLIVVDEEHDDSYKAHNRPRYHARDLAVYFGKKLDIPVLLGSATPCASSWEKYPVFRLKGGFYASNKSFIFDRSTEPLSPIVVDGLKKVLEKKKQTIVFLPTRANFKYLICKECGEAVKCPYCSVGMSIHFDKNALKCHYCDYAQAIPKECPNCKSSSLQANRPGTAEVVQELREIFPHTNVAKFDRDEITTHNKLKKILKEFSKGQIDILVGTQMLSKGHDYPDVGLSVVLGIDYILNMADYRAREKAVSLLVQIAGRSGRKEKGEVIVQSLNEEFFKNYLDYEKFLKEEIKCRKDLYPPFKRLALLLFSDKKEETARKNMQDVLDKLKNFKEVEIIGSGPAPLERIANRYRYNILLRSTSAKDLIKAISAVKTPFCEVDMDPVNIV
ncbi:primosomal protein N' [Nitrosophilus alvini]|uniref:primosomal protein N' n=1 Tax=Nitrosophilus alvini TaxID=2714855 RepID=UPI00190D92BC|nr:primosomal protein N' [Nitrosophilus alvini]